MWTRVVWPNFFKYINLHSWKKEIGRQETKDLHTFWEDEYSHKNMQPEKNRMQNA